MTKNKGERAAAYIRVSTQEQKLHGLSLEAQKMKLRDYAEINNLQIVSWYMDEGVSGRKLIKNRPQLQKMIQDAEVGKFERIIFVKLDRFFRSVAEYHECMKRIAPVTWTTTEEDYDLTTANGRMLVNMKLTIAELEADQTGERIRLVNDYKVKSGLPLVGPQSLPFFLTLRKVDGKKRVVKNPETEAAAYDLLDHFEKYQSKRATALYINKKYNIPMDTKIIARVLKSPMLYGQYRDNPNYCEAYITKERFDRIQLLSKRNVRAKKQRVYILTGLIKCPVCGNLLSGCSSIYKNKLGEQLDSKYYRCTAHYQSNRCSFHFSVGENKIENQLLTYVEKFFHDLKIREYNTSCKSSSSGVIDLNKIQAEINRLNYSWQKGRIQNVEDYDRQYEQLIGTLHQAQETQKKADSRDFSYIDDILTDGWKPLYEALDNTKKQAFWRSFIKSIELEWDGDNKRIEHIDFL